MQITNVNLRYVDGVVRDVSISYTKSRQSDTIRELLNGTCTLSFEDYDGQSLEELITIIEEKRDAE